MPARGLEWAPLQPLLSLPAAGRDAAGAGSGRLAAGLFLVQAFTAIWQLELVNYIEHYGLTRRHLGEGKYEHVLPRHSWNADLKASNWLLINLQRHSDHHYKPDRRFPCCRPTRRGPQLSSAILDDHGRDGSAPGKRIMKRRVVTGGGSTIPTSPTGTPATRH
jgi:hypothetical protein